jgi:hypothetical protein
MNQSPDSTTSDTNVVTALVQPNAGTNPQTSPLPAAPGTNEGIMMAGVANTPGSSSSLAAATNHIQSLAAADADVPARSATPSPQPPALFPPVAMARMDGRMPGMGGPPLVDLPPALGAQVMRITDSEILGPIMHPLPEALLGIAGDFAFLRSANGQTGVVQAGENVGGLKLLRIGINRVLVEQDGEKKELTIFSGFGGESLLPQSEKHP